MHIIISFVAPFAFGGGSMAPALGVAAAACMAIGGLIIGHRMNKR